MRYYLAFRQAIPQQKVGSCRSSPVCHWFDLAVSSVRLACLRYTASIHPEPGSNSQLKLNFKRHSLPLSKWQKNSIKYVPSTYLAASLVKELRYCNNHTYVWQVENNTPKEEIITFANMNILPHSSSKVLVSSPCQSIFLLAKRKPCIKQGL